MLAINVSIPNLTVARLEQFPSPQMTDNKPSFTWKPHVVIFHQSPFAANTVPKLVDMATSLDPWSRVCLHWIAWPRKPTPRIKQRVASCHTAEVMLIQSLPAPPPTPRGQPISEMGGDPHHVWYGRAHIATDWHYCFKFPDFPRSMEWRGSTSRFWVRKYPKSGVFRPSNLLGGTYEHPYRTYTISAHTASCGKVSRK